MPWYLVWKRTVHWSLILTPLAPRPPLGLGYESQSPLVPWCVGSRAPEARVEGKLLSCQGAWCPVPGAPVLSSQWPVATRATIVDTLGCHDTLTGGDSAA